MKSIYDYFLDQEHLDKIASENAEKYQKATPFPHIVLDQVFPNEVLDEVLEEFPSPTAIEWQEFKNKNELKLASRDETQFGAKTRYFIHLLNSYPFLKFLEKLTGIPNLLADASLEGGGLHQILPGGLLKIHADFNKHPKTNIDRRLNVLIYLNKNWEEEYGGYFELWDKNMEKAEAKILPLFNRMAIFSTTSTSYHGHPDALKCPEGMSRKSIAMYYYTNGRPEEEVLNGLENHSTLFKARANHKENTEIKSKRSMRETIKLFIPPIITNLLQKN